MLKNILENTQYLLSIFPSFNSKYILHKPHLKNHSGAKLPYYLLHDYLSSFYIFLIAALSRKLCMFTLPFPFHLPNHSLKVNKDSKFFQACTKIHTCQPSKLSTFITNFKNKFL